eukprot:364426-Chlamydomonas_euryale.AAC.6
MTASWSAVRPVTGWRWSRPATLPSGRRSASSAANSLSSLFDRTASTSALPPRASRLAPSPERELGVCMQGHTRQAGQQRRPPLRDGTQVTPQHVSVPAP